MKVEVFESEKEFSPSPEIAEEIRDGFEDSMFESEMAITVLTLLNAKPACDIEGFFRSENYLQDFLEKLNSTGLNCYLERDPEETMAETFSSFMDGESSSNVQMMVDSEVTVRIFITSETYEESYFEPIFRNNYGPDFHRRYGEFLGFDEENIEAFVYDNLPVWKKLFYVLKEDSPPETVTEFEALEKYGDSLDEMERKVFSAFNFQKLADTGEAFDQALEKSRRRRNKVEEDGFEVDFFIRNLASPKLVD